ncbi:MAG: MATE family efflux transporter [Bacillota bacterium]|nr:MATE family efflux transporter [Bacillota bacterium]
MEQNKMGYMPINKLLISMSLPMMISMLIQALYNIVDSMFVAQINEDALTAVSLAFPMQNLMIAVATGTGVGINALLSRSLGQNRKDKASLAAENGLFLALLSSIAFIVIGLTCSKTFFSVQSDNARIVEYGHQYLLIIQGLCFGVFLQITFERILQATGRTIHTMITQGMGAIINIILDPIFIFGYFGIPKMGVAGAAIATVIGQILAMSLACFFNLKFNHDVELSLKGFKPNGSIIGQIYRVGFPSIIMASIGSIMTFGMNQILLAFQSTAAAFFGVYMKLQSFVLMPVFGLNNGLVPIISFNYGAANQERILETIKMGVIYAMSMMGVGLILFEFFPIPLLKIFNASETMIQIGVPGLRIIASHFVFAGLCIVLGTTFQALNRSVYSLINSVCRQLVVLLPVAYVLSLTHNLDLVWLSFPIAEVSSLVLSLIFFKKIYHDQIKKL